MMIFTDPEGIVIWANPATEIITGFTKKEIIGRKAGLLWGKLMSKDFYDKLWYTIKTEKKVFTGEIQNHRRSGANFWSVLTIYPLVSESGEPEYFVATQRDITHEKEVDQMKTDFISLASHQLRTPLSAMRWFLEMLIGGDLGTLSASQKEAINNVALSNQRMTSLVNALLNISRIESGRLSINPVPTELSQVIKTVIAEQTEALKLKNITLDFSPNLKPILNLDPSLVREVVANYLSNAIKYTGKNGKITITLEKNLKGIKFAISDNGYGIPHNMIKKKVKMKMLI